MTAPRVAMVGLRAPWGADGGVEHAVAALAPRLVQRGFAVTVYCRRRYNQLGPGIHDGVRLVDVDTLYGKHTEAFVHTLLATPRASLGHDLVHIHAMGPALFASVPRLFGRRTVVTVHAEDFARDKWGGIAQRALRLGEWSAARFAHEAIVVGRHLEQAFQDRHQRPTTVIPNGAATIAEASLNEAGVEGLVSGQYLLFVGRIVPEKGLRPLFEAYKASGVRLPLVITGDALHAETHLARLRRDAPPGVRFTGARRGRARDALLRHARAFVNPSRLEGLPLAPLEALSAGLPVLLSDIPPHREVLGEPSRGGWLVREGEWVEALQRVAALTPAELAAVGQAGIARVAAHFSWDDAAEQTAAVYRRVLGDALPAGASAPL